MRLRTTAAVGITALLATLTAAPAPAHAQPRGPIPPRTAVPDAFYTPPAGYEGTAPGTVLRSRRVQTAALSLLPQPVEAWQLLYRTADQHGRPMATVTTVLRPSGGAPKGLVSYQIAQDSSAPHCAPSHAIRLGNPLDGVTGNLEILLADSVVANGFAVSVPDYQGPDSQFGAPKQPGYAILDGVRAAQRFAPLDLPGSRTPVGIWGYSGGSLASGWAAETQPGYAPELNVRGVAVGGFVTDFGQALLKINGGYGGGLIASVLPGVLRSNPDLARIADRYLTPEGRALLARSTTQCVGPNVLRYLFFDADRYLTVPLRTLLDRPEVREALERHDLGKTAPTAPMFVYHAVHDELIPVDGADRAVRGYCARGTKITYTREQVSSHGSLAVTGGPAVLSWLTRRLDGTLPDPAGCSTRTIPSTLLTPEATRDVPHFLLSVVQGMQGRRVVTDPPADR
ncbi:lipase family protein [Actinomadura kijaniata]|uniref:lipase family protein n=1 Tax=Actinomadura kijaniata TaxID=46161 RepID=UPI00082DBDF4|nr:lipase family protein [Actinomadura kijaniata]